MGLAPRDDRRCFRPDDVGALQRLVHWVLATLGLLYLTAIGAPGLMAYLVGVAFLHLRFDQVRGRSAMDLLLQAREQALGRAWTAFLAANHRRTMSLPGRRPHRFFAIASLVALLALSLIVGEGMSEVLGGLRVASRLGIALAGSAMLWLAFFGLSRRTPLVFGADGVRVRDAFLPYATIVGVERQSHRVVIARTPPLPAISVSTPDSETADRLVRVFISELERARARRAAPSEALPAAGFRENASQAGWRVRLHDAASDEERRAVLARVPPDDLRELLEETADASLEDALSERLRGAR